MSLGEFRTQGYQFTHRHFDEYRKVRLDPKAAIKVFAPGEARKLMTNAAAFEIYLDELNNLVFSPKRIRKCSLANLEKVGRHAEVVIPLAAEENAFWAAADQVLATATVEQGLEN